MIPISETQEVEVSGVQASNAFTIKTTAAAFQLLSSGLYSNKIRAVIRELACNAHDAHVMVKSNAPVEIKLPNALDTQFYVKDFGPGLNHDQVMRLYTTYFDSTKQDSNDFIGGFGVGSKSPFAYTDSFTVEARQNGVSRTYTAYVDERQVPQIVYMGEAPTDEPNGLTVGFPVKPQDFNKFNEEALSVGSWFETPPTLRGTPSVIESIPTLPLSDTVAFPKDRYALPSPMVRLGNVAYPIKNRSLESGDERSARTEWLLNRKVILTMDIGTVSVAASREELSYDKPTIAALNKKLDEAASVCGKEIITQLLQFDATTREGILAAHNFLNDLGLNHLEVSANTIENHVNSQKTHRLPLLNQFLLEQDIPVSRVQSFVLPAQILPTTHISIGRGRTSRIADIDYQVFDKTRHSYATAVNPSQGVILIEKDLHKSSPLASRAWRNAYSQHVNSSGRKYRYNSQDVTIILERNLDSTDEEYEADKKKIMNSLGVSKTLKLSDFLSEADQKKLSKNTTKRTTNAKSLISGRIVSAVEGQNVYWICSDTINNLKKVKHAKEITSYIDNIAADTLKCILPLLDIPSSAKVVSVTEADIPEISTYNNATNLVEYISSRIESKEFKDKIAAIPKAKGSVSGPLFRVLSRSDSSVLKALNDTLLGQDIQAFVSLVSASENEEAIDLYKGLASLRFLDEHYCSGVLNIPEKVQDISSLNSTVSEHYPMLEAYLQQNRWSDNLKSDHIKNYVQYCENSTPALKARLDAQQHEQTELTFN